LTYTEISSSSSHRLQEFSPKSLAVGFFLSVFKQSQIFTDHII
jgi:hypothetical protein